MAIIIYIVLNKRFGYIVKFNLIFTAYLATVKFGLTLNSVSHFAPLIWAPTGIALAALFILRYRYWPAITLAAFTINLVTGASLLVALGISIGNTLEPLFGAYFLKRIVKFNPYMLHLSIALLENGVGIVKNDVAKLIKKFSRIDNLLSTAVGGSGLGLYWAKKIINLHQGSINVKSHQNKGSTFIVTFPNSYN